MRSSITKTEDAQGPKVTSHSVLSRWLPTTIFLSLLCHLAFLWWTRGVTLNTPIVAVPEQRKVRPFRLIKPPPPLSKPQPTPASELQKASSPQSLSLPVEKVEPRPDAGTLSSTNSPPLSKIDPMLLQEKPGGESSSLDQTIQKTVAEGARKASQEADSLQKQLLRDHPPDQPLIELPQPNHTGGGAQGAASGRHAGSAPKGFSDLDTLLAQTGPLKSETSPILMPTDLLFDYDKSDLRAEAVGSLRKLGMLIQRNPQATFLIEGHTDSFGSDAYNLDLSLQRAEAVKVWLLQTMGIAPERITTKGYGKSRLIVPASGTIEQQQINRRVEIVIRTPKNQL